VTSSGAASGAAPLRVVLVDDSTLFRSGVAALLREAGVDVVGEASDVGSAFAAVETHRPDVAVLDVRMPPTHTDEGVRAAIALRERFGGLGVLVLSTYAESEWVERLLAGGADRLGYLLKDRVDDVGALVDALHRLAAGGTAVDAEVVARLVRVRARSGALDRLTARERDVLALMAEGLSNSGIARRLFLSAKTVEAHIAAIFDALDLANGGDVNRRVRAVVAFLRAAR
jgi:DNA-binding NarL/FixJ family response regulator